VRTGRSCDIRRSARVLAVRVARSSLGGLRLACGLELLQALDEPGGAFGALALSLEFRLEPVDLELVLVVGHAHGAFSSSRSDLRIAAISRSILFRRLILIACSFSVCDGAASRASRSWIASASWACKSWIVFMINFSVFCVCAVVGNVRKW